MKTVDQSLDTKALLEELEGLRKGLFDAESTLEAIRSGSVDALVVSDEKGESKVFTLKGADEPYRIFVEKMQEGAVTLDSVGTILYCNLAFANMIGEPLQRVIGTTLQKLLPDEETCRKITAPIGLGRIETTLVSTAKRVPVICSVTPVDLGGTAAFAVTITDLTFQKEQESLLKRANAELEGFCYSVSHDMRAPLRSMISAASIVMQDYTAVLPEDAKNDLQRIVSSANHLGCLMDDLLTYSRLSRAELVRSTVNMSELAHRIADNLHMSYGPIQWQIQPGLEGRGDARLLEMVMYNLFANAAKFTAKTPKPLIEFGQDTNSAYFVRDNGIGFSMDYVDKLFRPFERLHRQQEYPGTGIGLANVKRIITRHGGTAWAEGAEGLGAAFYFTLC